MTSKLVRDLLAAVDDIAAGTASWADLSVRLRDSCDAAMAWVRVHGADGRPGGDIAGPDRGDRDRARSDDRDGACEDDFSLLALLQVPPGSAVCHASLHADARYVRTAFYQRHLAPLNVDHLLDCLAGPPGGPFLRLTIARWKGDAPFRPREISGVEAIAHHMISASRIRMYHLGAAQRVTNLVDFDLVPDGVMLVERDGRISRVNLAARISLRDGIRIEDGRIRCDNPKNERALVDLIERAQFRQRPGMIGEATLSSRLGGVLDVVVTNIRIADRADEIGTALFVSALTPAAAKVSDFERLAAKWLLTPKESTLAIAIVDGRTLSYAAEALGISYETARFHLKNIYRKTGVNSQSALVKQFITQHYAASGWVM